MIEKLQRSWTLVDDSHLHAQRRKHRGVFDSDYPCSDHCHSAGQLGESEYVIGGNHGLAIWIQCVRLAGFRADGDEEVVAGQHSLTGQRISADGMRVYKLSPAVYEFNVVARQGVVDDPDLSLDDTADMAYQLLHGGARPRLVGERIGEFKTGPGVVAADRLSEGFGGNGASFDADTTGKFFFFNDCNFFSELSSLNGCPLPRRTATDTNKIIIVTAMHPSSIVLFC